MGQDKSRDITIDWLRSMYGEIAMEEASKLGGLRPCECDVMSLLEYETDWTGIANALNADNASTYDAIAYLRVLVNANLDRACRSVSSLSDTSYEAVKLRYRQTHGEQAQTA
jgi:hypothetical protein